MSSLHRGLRRSRAKTTCRVRVEIWTGGGYVGFSVQGERRSLTPLEARSLGESFLRVEDELIITLKYAAPVAFDAARAHHWGSGLIAAAQLAEAEAIGVAVSGGES